jgi:hypothetical protein
VGVLIAATLRAVGAPSARFGASSSGIAKALAIAAVAAAFDAAAGASVVRALAGAPPDLGAGLASLVLVGPAVAALAAVPRSRSRSGRRTGPRDGRGRVLAASTAGARRHARRRARALPPRASRGRRSWWRSSRALTALGSPAAARPTP